MTASPTPAISESPTSTATQTPTLVPIPTATRVRAPTRTATPSPPVAEPTVLLKAFYVRPAWDAERTEHVGTITLYITIQVARVSPSPIQLAWSISNGQRILAHHQIHTGGWTGTRTFLWRHDFASPGSYICVAVARLGGHTQARVLALDVRR